ncbi:MAG TPA: YceI family protein [Flavobacteriales bacterium]|nr:YceI family protein [Flavobacteriales bacterium]HRO38597.1 YceI family protein [Flavobacteriales bacterium]HRP81595.1 YceI family protein [Flavobacteriales bacterium]
MNPLNSPLLLGALVGVLALSACGSTETPAASSEAPSTATAPAGTYALHPGSSHVGWSGTMLGVKTHTGTLKFSEGELALADGKLAGGKFTVDMTSYLMTDTNYAADGSAQGTRQNLMEHLMSPDFFAVDSFPVAHFTITKVEGNTATGNLTVRGRTHEEQVKNIVLSTDGSTVTATGDLTFDRQKYGVSWKAPMKDLVLSNDIVLKMQLTGNKMEA